MLTAIGYALKAVFDNDPTTNLDVSQLVLAFTAGVGLLHAKDASSNK